MDDLKTRYERMRRSLALHPNLAVAFSGGVDSSLVLWAAKEAMGDRAMAMTVISPFFTTKEREHAKEVASSIGMRQMEIEVDLLADDAIVVNDRDRCYHCKRSILQTIIAAAQELGITTVVDGGNADDAVQDRPGEKAIRELNVLSPLAENEIGKEEVRALARRFGLNSADRPATACLASRVPYGERLTEEKLLRIGRAEDVLREMGFTQLRVRLHGAIARLEVNPEEMDRALDHRAEIVTSLQELGFTYVTLDLKGFRSGSMDEVARN